MKITPYFAEKPWGGDYLSDLFQTPSNIQIGEAFIISTLSNNESLVQKTPLSKYLESELPYLVKIIDAAQNLSIQVHPNDHWAQVLENSIGKTECWYVIDAEVGSGIYYGFKDGHSFNTLNEAIQKNEDASKCLNFIQVKRGDFIEVPAGTIHAIGAGVKILEFQQASGITYRIWDWARVGRELHLDKAWKVTIDQITIPEIINFEQIPTGVTFFKHTSFELTKTDAMTIKCSSNSSRVYFEVNINDYSCKAAGI